MTYTTRLTRHPEATLWVHVVGEVAHEATEEDLEAFGLVPPEEIERLRAIEDKYHASQSVLKPGQTVDDAQTVTLYDGGDAAGESGHGSGRVSRPPPGHGTVSVGSGYFSRSGAGTQRRWR